ncbi:undecaprenyl/decaprenyl-phosphate alpha-N-acetylglucosaminyl 1-phosphate transferase [Bacteroides sp. AM07-16]|nr:undecaprenyl/decaprenyl-phosphate alpha-N-acetylglucosaminyl 1-phosphate transferase [Bacteroides sp. AM07-16]
MLTLCLLIFCIKILDVSNIIVREVFSDLFCFLLSFLLALYLLPRILLICKRKHLYDMPNARKVHAYSVPRLGGLVFVPSILCTLPLVIAFRFMFNLPLDISQIDRTVLESCFLMCGVCFLYLVGAKDDLVGVSYRKKILAQFLVAVLISCSGIYINDLYGLFGIHAIPAWIGIPFTTVLIMYITNAVNLIDGIDGLAVGECSLFFLIFGVLFMVHGSYIYSMLSFSLLGCLLPFTYYNIFGSAEKGTKIFMGDSGSLTLGYFLAFLTVKYVMYTPEYYSPYDVSSIIIPLSVLFVPCFDAFRVMLVRAYNHHSLFQADRNHIHHKCLDAGLTHLQSTCLILLYSLVLVLLNICMIDFFNINIIVILDILSFILLLVWLNINKIYDK